MSAESALLFDSPAVGGPSHEMPEIHFDKQTQDIIILGFATVGLIFSLVVVLRFLYKCFFKEGPAFEGGNRSPGAARSERRIFREEFRSKN